MTKQNPFSNSDDNKRYYTWNYYLKHRFQSKVFKVALNANFSCPNRDGTCGYGGCTFCSSMGSGDYAGNVHDSLRIQYEKGIEKMQTKWPSGIPMPYFQAFSNTYASLTQLKQIYDPFLQDPNIKAISIATRPDCLDKEKIEYFNSYTNEKEIWIELGLQSIHDETAQRIHRGHTYECLLDCLELLRDTNLKICIHLMNSLPYETKEMMLKSAKAVSKLSIHAIKIHMLHIMEHTQMAKEYKEAPFKILSKEEYIDIVVSQLELLPPNMVIQRLTGDGVKELLITPEWTLKKVVVLNDIDKEMKRRDTWQGKKFV